MFKVLLTLVTMLQKKYTASVRAAVTLNKAHQKICLREITDQDLLCCEKG